MRDFQESYVSKKGRLRQLESDVKRHYQPPGVIDPEFEDKSLLLKELREELEQLQEDTIKVRRRSYILLALWIIFFVVSVLWRV